jgi:hypothetical protein
LAIRKRGGGLLGLRGSGGRGLRALKKKKSWGGEREEAEGGGAEKNGRWQEKKRRSNKNRTQFFFFKKRLKWVKTGLFYKMGTGGLKILSPLSFFSYALLFILFYKKYHIF